MIEASIRPKPKGIRLLASNIIISKQQYAKERDKITFWPPGRTQDSSFVVLPGFEGKLVNDFTKDRKYFVLTVPRDPSKRLQLITSRHGVT
jgi:hypothetical protein